jgi:hypothetical protein
VRDVLGAAAVIGRKVSVSVLLDVASRDEDAVVDALSAELDLAQRRPEEAHGRLTAILVRATEDVYRDLAVIPLLAEADVVLGRADDAERRIAEAIGRAEEYGERLHLIDLPRTHGLVLNALSRYGEGLTAVERSLALAREVGTPYGEGHTLGALSNGAVEKLPMQMPPLMNQPEYSAAWEHACRRTHAY